VSEPRQKIFAAQSWDNLTVLGNRLLFTAPNGLDADGFRNDMELFAASMK
jgi:hypothetical protein